ncbi:MAG: GNAT family N-acetyltransferase [Burkholderiales bacterium]|nr:GNAT family N-acetyltransferase [Opitutaceae bacterium]
MNLLAKVRTRALALDEVPRVTEWAMQEGWNPGRSDAYVFNAADPGSCIAVEANGGPVGVITAVRMTACFGFLGFFVLDGDHRSSVYGWTLWQAALERLGDRVIGGDGVLPRLPNYARYGFVPHYYTTSYRSVASVRPAVWRPGVEHASSTPLAELAAYDAVGYGVSRAAVLREWLALPSSLALVFKREGRLCGLGAARRCHEGVRIGPLQADDPEAAEALFDALAGLMPGELISIDCPENNPGAVRLLRKKGMIAGIVTARLYRGEPPVNTPARVYGQMSFALG